MLENENDVKLGSYAVGEKRSSHATANSEAGFSAVGAILKKVVTDLEGQGTRKCPKRKT